MLINVMQSSKMSLNSKIVVICFWHFLLGYNLSFNLMKTPWRLSNWFLRYSILRDCKNNKKQRNYLLFFGYIFLLIFATSDSFCLIASQMFSCWNGDPILSFATAYDFSNLICPFPWIYIKIYFNLVLTNAKLQPVDDTHLCKIGSGVGWGREGGEGQRGGSTQWRSLNSSHPAKYLPIFIIF